MLRRRRRDRPARSGPRHHAPRRAARTDHALSARGLFVVFSLILIVPVAGLGLLLDHANRSGATGRALDDGRASARLLAQTSVQPAISGRNLESGLDVAGIADLGAAVEDAVSQGRIIGLTVRSLSGTVVFPPQQVGQPQTPADLAAAAQTRDGGQPAKITQAQRQDRVGGGRVRAIQVYAPVVAPSNSRVIGTLEVLLPYDQVAAQVTHQTRVFGLLLLSGLAILYSIVALLAHQVTGRLRKQLATTDHLAHHDVLTGLPNRALHRKHAAAALTRANHRGVVIAILDLNRFKQINDTLGHSVGDELLRVVGRRLLEVVRTDDTVARLGGDEFGLVLPGGSMDQAMTVLERVHRVLSEPVEIEGRLLPLSASIGAAEAGAHGADFDVLMRKADAAMYAAKRSGRGLAVASRDGEDEADSTLLMLGSELTRAIEDDQMVLHYQPLIQIDDERLTTVEALVRWQHPIHGLLPPAHFLPAAEETGAIHQLTDWVLERALVDVGRLADDIRVAVNVSPSTLTDRGFALRVKAVLDRIGIPAHRLVLEMTESALVRDVDAVATSLTQLREVGVGLSLDDFGQGSTSLSFLRVLPLTEVKIDRSFVTSSESDLLQATIIESMVRMVHAAGMTIVAEGVEDSATYQRITRLGCDVAQGWHLGYPVPIADLVERYGRSSLGMVRTGTLG